jgi:enamine deaminase RidA (YjgF/YER057c/UK114 family)
MIAHTPTARPKPALAQLKQIRELNFDATVFPREKLVEIHATLRLQPAQIQTALERLAQLLHENNAKPIKVEAFGDVAAYPEIVGWMLRLFPNFPGSVLWLEGKAPAATIAGLHVFAIGGGDAEALMIDGQVVGSAFHDGFARHYILNHVLPDDFVATPTAQARQVFARIERTLEQFGMDFRQVVRTWFFLDGILDWYAPFNQVRTGLFEKWKVFDGIVPASTGVGVKNAEGAALVSGLWAVQPGAGALQVRELPSPLQCPAPRYGSSFSRAVEIIAPDMRRTWISGTASIHPDGTTARLGNVAGQIDLTMEVVGAILNANHMEFSDATRATAYFQDIRNAPLFVNWCREREIQLPVLMVQGDVCRSELLFELELDAIKSGKGGDGEEML